MLRDIKTILGSSYVSGYLGVSGVSGYSGYSGSYANVDDVPVTGKLTAPISLNWAYDHENDTSAHGVSGAVMRTLDQQTLTSKTSPTPPSMVSLATCRSDRYWIGVNL